jgi:hypothetical protein
MPVENIAINFNQQSTLAKLLAKENINVIHGSYKTAWFDPQRRVLALPVWKNKGKAVYDLLTGHEVGHALYTPALGWHDAVDDVEGAPKAYLNVLEDVRIERKVQDKYPGLRSQFQKAYKQLSAEDFFGIESVDVDSIRVIDKINLKSKLGPNIEVKFDSIERGFYNASFKTETFEEVVKLAKDIYAYQKALEETAPRETQQPIINQSLDDLLEDDGSTSEDDYQKPDQSEESGESEETKDETLKGQTGKGHDGKNEGLDEEDVTKGPSEKSTQDEQEVSAESLTDKAFRDREKELVVTDLQENVFTINKVRQSNIVIDYKDYFAEWEKHLRFEDPDKNYLVERLAEQKELLKDKYRKFKTETEMAAAYMAKEFELRKAAFQYSRSKLEKTGIINTNKLHAYKYSEDIFLKSTKLANYKNHGMMMFIDFSGSMQDNLGATIRQLLNLTLFCRMVQIPYEVYAFTTRVRDDQDDRSQKWEEFSDNEIIPEKFNLLNLMSSRMTRAEYNKAQEMLWTLSQAWDGSISQWYINTWNQLHSTPLNTCIVVANEMIKKFKLQHNIENMTAMFLSDGESDNFQVRQTEEGEKHRTQIAGYYYRSRKCYIRIDGKTLELESAVGSAMTEGLLKFLKESTNSNVLGFFISQYRNQAINKVLHEVGSANYIKNKEKYTSQMSKNRAIIEDKIFGYDRYFGLCTKYMDIIEDEFGELVEDGASKGKIKTAFAKMTKAKRVNRVLLNAFVDSIA